MKYLIAALMLTFVVTTPALGSTSLEFYQDPVTPEQPIVYTFTTSQVGELTVFAYFTVKGGAVAISGPQSCSNSAGRYPLSIGCAIPDAPIGTYTMTISSRKVNPDVYAFLRGEF